MPRLQHFFLPGLPRSRPAAVLRSYSRRDNKRGQVTALEAQIESSFRAFAGRDLQVFFDTREIAGMDDWRQKIQRGLPDSQVFLAVLSPHYLASPCCRWEWEDMRQYLGAGVAPRPDAADPKADQALARWSAPTDLRPAPVARRGEQASQRGVQVTPSSRNSLTRKASLSRSSVKMPHITGV